MLQNLVFCYTCGRATGLHLITSKPLEQSTYNLVRMLTKYCHCFADVSIYCKSLLTLDCHILQGKYNIVKLISVLACHKGAFYNKIISNSFINRYAPEKVIELQRSGKFREIQKSGKSPQVFFSFMF